ncbi:hypothetical protein VP1G_10798 [Cytospora mali]|uniref:Uncharacterized protein n=1 Tax=Cytospora mali TaxID=578113 RepID=A0A194UWP7_CYTMA|nr:hypothetical protein VP1G_10798 [Valsa mali var. pyri (nom. inval.)]
MPVAIGRVAVGAGAVVFSPISSMVPLGPMLGYPPFPPGLPYRHGELFQPVGAASSGSQSCYNTHHQKYHHNPAPHSSSAQADLQTTNGSTSSVHTAAEGVPADGNDAWHGGGYPWNGALRLDSGSGGTRTVVAVVVYVVFAG